MMLTNLIAECDTGDRLRGEGRLIDALDRYRETLNRLRAFPGVDHVVASLRLRAARGAAEILIHQNGDLEEIYTLLSNERAALTNLIAISPGPERLYRQMSAFVNAARADDEIATKQAVTSVLMGLFGHLRPADALETHLALIRNTLVRAEMIFDRENDVNDARALAEIALSEILALLPNTTTNLPSHPAILLLTDTLDLLARFNGQDSSWFERAKIICTLLPTAPTPWAMGLIQPADIAALMLGVGEPEAA